MKEVTLKILIVIPFLVWSMLSALTIGPWSNIRFSGKTAANQAYLQTEIPLTDIYTNNLIYNSGTTMTEVSQTLYNSTTGTYQSVFPVGTSRCYVGLRLQAGTSHENIVPIPYQGTNLPAMNLMTQVSTDATDLTIDNYLDITQDFFTFSGTKFYAGIQNRGGGFPTSTSFGTVYLSYMCVLAPPGSDPSDPDVVVWALVYMNVPLGGISPGLYKITGTGTSDLIRIGDIQYQINTDTNLLAMSCDISALLADADFAAWYNILSPSFGFASLTSRTTVIPFATTPKDETDGGKIHPVALWFDPIPNQLPILSNPVFHADESNVWFGMTYSDAEYNFPLTANVNLPGNQSFELYPQSSDFSAPVEFRTANLISSMNEYDHAVAVFSCSDNNIAYATTSFDFTYIRGLKSPEDVQCELTDTELILSWSPVTLTLESNPVEVSHYRIEAASNPEFSPYSILGTSTSTSFSLNLSGLTDIKFYRIIAIK